MKDYLLMMCEESHRCNPDTIGYELIFGGIIVAILLIAYAVKRIKND